MTSTDQHPSFEPTTTTDSVRFGPFEFSGVTRELYRDGLKVDLPDRAARVLALLLRNPGEMIAKEQIYAEVWPETAVSEHSLTEAISLVRQALGDDSRCPAFVETIRGRGYRFITPRTPSTAEGPTPSENTPSDRRPIPVAQLVAAVIALALVFGAFLMVLSMSFVSRTLVPEPVSPAVGAAEESRTGLRNAHGSRP
ncbi:MAG: hypothetical protein GKS06_09860 [Acidobacteria bacterium]|nr:hypothetical protein [Acidobacteriota bacterium]